MVIEALSQRMTEMQADQDKRLREAAEALARYESVQQMVTLPGWQAFALDLDKRSQELRTLFEEILTAMLVCETPGLRERYIDTKIQLLAMENALHLYRWMRDAATDSKNFIDMVTPKV